MSSSTSKSRSGGWGPLLRRRLPIVRWMPLYGREDAVADLVAGLTLGLTLIPQSIAYALLAGLAPQYGLYSSFLGSLVYVLMGTIKEVSIGPTSLMSLLTAQYTHDQPVQAVILLTFLAGAVQLGMALLQLGFLVDLISDPVTSGFTSAYSVMIAVSQLKGLLGLRFKAHGFVDTLCKLAQHITEAKLADSMLGVGCVVVLIGMKKLGTVGAPGSGLRRVAWVLSIGRNALVVLVCAVTAYVWENVAHQPVPFALSGQVQPGLPPLSLPPFSAPGPANTTLSFVDMATSYGGGLLVVPVVGVLANIAIAKSFSNGAPVDASQEMVTLATCNLLASCVSSMPTCGAFTRSAVSNASGVRTPLAGLYSGMLILLALVLLTPYFYYIPKATLAAVLISAVVFLVDFGILKPLWRNSKRSLLVTVLTFAACLGMGVEAGLLLGVSLDLAHLVYLWARPPITVQLCKARWGEYVLVRPEVGLFFPAMGVVRDAVVTAAAGEGGAALPMVLDCTHFRSLDYTAVKGLEVLVRELGKRGQALHFMGLPASALRLVAGLGMKGFTHCAAPRDLPGILHAQEGAGDKADSLSRAETGLALVGADEDEGRGQDDHELSSMHQQQRPAV
ncbi:sodium-independent sulfate anion transporter-like isoform X1 [Frankliniella occidentalis]|uniref:Sodium-independent sulfate anion transporter-like isoform X1 n=1 Tax=Frankliniella occidentalis TaxID=133901 RepID=A0A6J1SSH9_FRAOC|nr:sodium-independent sulfate anion transporter-like isoform X1 [Frankliniella occidentalis]